MMIFELSLDLFDDVKKRKRVGEYIFKRLMLKMLVNLMIETLILIDLIDTFFNMSIYKICNELKIN